MSTCSGLSITRYAAVTWRPYILVNARRLHRQPELGDSLVRVEHNTHSRQVRRAEPISSLDLANTEQLARLVVTNVHDDDRGSVVELCGRDLQRVGETLVIDEEGAEEGGVHLKLSDLSLGQVEGSW